MKCNIRLKIPIKRLRQQCKADEPDYLFDEVDGYTFDKNSIFSIAKLEEFNNPWWLIHRPSDTLMFPFERKRDLELFLSFYLDIVDEGELYYITPKYSQIEKQLYEAYQIAYPRFWNKSKGR